jgi:hypothetical protein
MFPVEQRTHARRRLLLVACSLLGGLAPATVFAHVKWFEDPTLHPLRTELILSDRTLLWLATSAAAVLGLALLQRLVGHRAWPQLLVFQRLAVGAPTILAVQAAIALVSAAAQPALLVPNLRLGTDPVGLALVALQLAVACSFITGLADWLGALALLVLVPAAALRFPALDVLEQALWVGKPAPPEPRARQCPGARRGGHRGSRLPRSVSERRGRLVGSLSGCRLRDPRQAVDTAWAARQAIRQVLDAEVGCGRPLGGLPLIPDQDRSVDALQAGESSAALGAEVGDFEVDAREHGASGSSVERATRIARPQQDIYHENLAVQRTA